MTQNFALMPQLAIPIRTFKCQRAINNTSKKMDHFRIMKTRCIKLEFLEVDGNHHCIYKASQICNFLSTKNENRSDDFPLSKHNYEEAHSLSALPHLVFSSYPLLEA